MSYPSIYTNRNLLYLTLFFTLGDWEAALPLVEESIQIEPNYQYAFGYRGLLKYTLGWPNRALIDLQKATAAQEKVDHVVASLIGVCYTCLGKKYGRVYSCVQNVFSHSYSFAYFLIYYIIFIFTLLATFVYLFFYIFIYYLLFIIFYFFTHVTIAYSMNIYLSNE